MKSAIGEAHVAATAPGVRRVVADNSGPLTGPGTNTYVVGEDDLAVIDPGPDDERHRAAILATIDGARVTHILLTHAHRDHAAGAPALLAATGAIRVDASTLPDGAVVAGPAWSLQSVATPGHAPDHLCFALLGTDVLFSGDHVMGWSTTMIAPPEGRMADYMASLDRLLERAETLYLPGHGDPIADGPARVRELVAHRRRREAEILDRLRRGDRTIEAIVAALYPALDSRLVGPARLSVLAHLEDLVDRDLAGSDRRPSPSAIFSPAA